MHPRMNEYELDHLRLLARQARKAREVNFGETAREAVFLFRRCPLLAQSGHAELHRTCPLLGAKRTSLVALHMSAYDPKRTWRLHCVR